VLLFVLIIIIK